MTCLWVYLREFERIMSGGIVLYCIVIPFIEEDSDEEVGVVTDTGPNFNLALLS